MVKRKVRRYQRGNQKLYIGGQTIQWSKEKLEDTKGVIRSVYRRTDNTMVKRKVRRYQRGNQKLYIGGQTIQ